MLIDIIFYISHILPNIRDPVLLKLESILLAVVFFFSAVQKIRDLRYFTRMVASFQMLPRSWVNPFAYTLPWLELALGLMLLLGWGTRLAANISATLMLLFIFAMGINLARGRKDLDCGCFGNHHHQVISIKSILRNLVLIIISVPLIIWGGGLLAFDNLPIATQQLILDAYIFGILLPLVSVLIGLVLFVRLVHQLARLVSLTTMDQRQ
jgi:uncharacterized membrane protein YphA (DoxX/SURF4 family)